MKKKNILNYLKSAAMGFSKGLCNEFEIAVVIEPSVFEPLKFYSSFIVDTTGRFIFQSIFCSLSLFPRFCVCSSIQITSHTFVPLVHLFVLCVCVYVCVLFLFHLCRSGPKVIKPFPCSDQLSMKF